MKIDITLNGVKTSKDIPIGWDEVTFRQLLGVKKARNEAQIISVFTGIDEDILAKAKIGNLVTIKALLSFLTTSPAYALPKEILGYKIKDNVEMEEIARYADMEAVIKTLEDNEIANLEKYPLIISTYVVEPYNFKDAENLAPLFLDAPAMEVLAVGNFTVVNMSVLSAITPIIAQLAASPRNNWRQALRNFIRRSAFTLFWFLLKRRFPSPVRRYLNGRFRSLNLTYGL